MSEVRKEFVSAPEAQSLVNKESDGGAINSHRADSSGCMGALPAGVVGGLQVLGRDNI